MEKIYIRPADLPSEEDRANLKTFITALYNREVEGWTQFPPTYSAKNYHLKRMQCKAGKARSFGDLLKISNTYFENVSPQQLLRVIYSIIGLKQTGKMLIYCPDVRKIVFHTNGWRTTKHRLSEEPQRRVLVDYLFYDYNDYIVRNNISYADEFDFFTVMSYIGLKKERLTEQLAALQEELQRDECIPF